MGYTSLCSRKSMKILPIVIEVKNLVIEGNLMYAFHQPIGRPLNSVFDNVEEGYG
jgi:hypothetical protein